MLKKTPVVAIAAVLLLAALTPAAQASARPGTEISSCVEIRNPGYFLVVSNLNGTMPGENYCLRVFADNVTVDFAGHSVSVPERSYAVYVHAARNVEVVGAKLRGTLFLEKATNVAVVNSEFSNVSVAVVSDSSSGVSLRNVKIENCTVGVRIESSTNVNVTETTITGCKEAVEVYKSSEVEVRRCTVERNLVGVSLSHSSGAKLVENLIASNKEEGISLVNTKSSAIYRNVVAENGVGIYVKASEKNTVCLNNFVNNSKQGEFDKKGGKNSWTVSTQEYSYRGGVHSSQLGNYWSDYSGVDANGDGVGDVSYVVAPDNVDTHPLVESFENYEILPAKEQSPAPGVASVFAAVAVALAKLKKRSR